MMEEWWPKLYIWGYFDKKIGSSLELKKKFMWLILLIAIVLFSFNCQIDTN